jgi:hypothetical protein
MNDSSRSIFTVDLRAADGQAASEEVSAVVMARGHREPGCLLTALAHQLLALGAARVWALGSSSTSNRTARRPVY